MKILWIAIFLLYIKTVSVNGDDSELEITEGDVRFFLHTREMGATELKDDKLEKIDLDKRTKFIVHGYRTEISTLWIRLMTDAFLRKGDYNVIVVDWTPLAFLDFNTTYAYLPIVGAYVGTIISELQKEFLFSLEGIHIVGHSLGAHVSGFIGKTVAKLAESKVSRITGLDPPEWTEFIGNVDDMLASSDAELVNVIHTSHNTASMGHIDFYPNGGGKSQPGCTVLTDVLEACSHTRSTYLFAEELENNRGFLGTRCDTMQHFTEGLCRNERRLTMGADLKLSDSGDYYFYTNPEYPYSIESVFDI